MFGADVTPNQHRLAEQFVLLDNFYATGGNSADGHQWLTQANETEYCLWPGYQGRSYPFDGSDPMAYSSGGFLWDYAQARGRTVRVFGEYAGRMRRRERARMELLRQMGERRRFHGATGTITRADRAAERDPGGELPGLLHGDPRRGAGADLSRGPEAVRKRRASCRTSMLLQLPSNHTNGTTPGASTPKAMVADNDLALGQIVEALSHRRFWPKMAIFVVEDDAQNGVDHVDGHRTTAFVVSPYARRGHVDSTFYSHQSMLKTIELILGLPTMSLFDLIAQRHARQLHRRARPDAVHRGAAEAGPVRGESAGRRRWRDRRAAAALDSARDEVVRAGCRSHGAVEPDSLGRDQGMGHAVSRRPKQSVFSPLSHGRGRRGPRGAASLKRDAPGS